MKKQDRMLKAKGYRQTDGEVGTFVNSYTCANGHKIQIKTHVFRTQTRKWARSTIVPESTMRIA